jgi:hypothetical protein
MFFTCNPARSRTSGQGNAYKFNRLYTRLAKSEGGEDTFGIDTNRTLKYV